MLMLMLSKVDTERIKACIYLFSKGSEEHSLLKLTGEEASFCMVGSRLEPFSTNACKGEIEWCISAPRRARQQFDVVVVVATSSCITNPVFTGRVTTPMPSTDEWLTDVLVDVKPSPRKIPNDPDPLFVAAGSRG